MSTPTAFGQQFQTFAASVSARSKLRLAPTPSGYLHVGNACNFILNWLAARAQPGARLLLRIDDLDADRKRPEYVADVFETLRWLELDWDEGPADPDDFEKNWTQRHRLDLYHARLGELRQSEQLFACRKSRRELAAYPESYPETFRHQNLGLDEPDVAWRIKTPPGWSFDRDFVVRRRDGIPAYQVASLSDDLHFDITHIIRGEDLAGSTAAQLFLAEVLGAAEFSRIKFLHHPLIEDDRGQKLSKSAGAEALVHWRERQEGPQAIFQQVARWLGWPSGPWHSSRDLLAFLQQQV